MSCTTFPVMSLIAMVLSHCSANLPHIQDLQLGVVLLQPPISLARRMVKMLARIPECTSNPHLQEHLMCAALHFITTVDKQPEGNGGRTPQLPLWASPESPPEDLGYSDIGLSPLEPKLMQANALAMVMPVVELQQPFQRDPALEGCVEWFVNTIQRCKAAGNEPLQPDDRRLICNVHMAPYLKLICENQLLCLFSMFASNINCGC